MSKTLFIFDLDGCLIDDSHRLPLIDWKARKFDAYHADDKMAKDSILPLGHLIFKQAVESGGDIVFFTARPSRVQERTQIQICSLIHSVKMTGAQQKYILSMRQEHEEGVPSAGLKRKMFEALEPDLKKVFNTSLNEYDRIYAFDDHPDVVKMYYTECDITSWLLSKSILCYGHSQGVLERIRKGDRQYVQAVPVNIRNGKLPADPSRFLESNLQETTTLRIAIVADTNPLQECPATKPLLESVGRPVNYLELQLADFYTKAAISPLKGICQDEVVKVKVEDGRQIIDYSDRQCFEILDRMGFNYSNHLSENQGLLNAGLITQGELSAQWHKWIEGAERWIRKTRPSCKTVREYLDFLKAKNKEVTRNAADVLDSAAATFRERNEMYKDNALVVGKVMTALFPKGVTLETAEDYHMWHLFELLIVKLTRFTNSGLTHQDSILDLTVYAAMLEPLINTHKIKIK